MNKWLIYFVASCFALVSLGAAIEALADPAPSPVTKAKPGVLREWTFDSDGDPEDWTGNPKTTSLPNLIVILADDMGIGDIGAFQELYSGGPEDVPLDLKDPGYEGDIAIQLAHQHTPHLDRLAKEGIRFTRAYSLVCAESPDAAQWAVVESGARFLMVRSAATRSWLCDGVCR